MCIIVVAFFLFQLISCYLSLPFFSHYKHYIQIYFLLFTQLCEYGLNAQTIYQLPCRVVCKAALFGSTRQKQQQQQLKTIKAKLTTTTITRADNQLAGHPAKRQQPTKQQTIAAKTAIICNRYTWWSCVCLCVRSGDYFFLYFTLLWLFYSLQSGID